MGEEEREEVGKETESPKGVCGVRVRASSGTNRRERHPPPTQDSCTWLCSTPVLSLQTLALLRKGGRERREG